MIVVCDTSPLLDLEAIGSLDSLPAVHGRVILPEAVLDELGALDAAPAHWTSLARAVVRAGAGELTNDGALRRLPEARGT